MPRRRLSLEVLSGVRHLVISPLGQIPVTASLLSPTNTDGRARRRQTYANITLE